ncbi:MAG: hypothetical protein HOV87_00480 [Catenulispora sp.]|nr:hypothetical protein [Catenulispora sp.]
MPDAVQTGLQPGNDGAGFVGLTGQVEASSGAAQNLRLPNTSSVRVNGICRLGTEAFDRASNLVLWSWRSLGHDGRLCCCV